MAAPFSHRIRERRGHPLAGHGRGLRHGRPPECDASAVTGTDGSTITRAYTYDNLGRKTSETLKRRNTPTDGTQINLTTSYSYDALDRVTRVTDATGNSLETVYDANGQTYQLLGPLQTVRRHNRNPDPLHANVRCGGSAADGY